jgi:hypothetical protein
MQPMLAIGLRDIVIYEVYIMCESTAALHDNERGRISTVKTEGLHHLGLTVFDVVKTAEFFYSAIAV